MGCLQLYNYANSVSKLYAGLNTHTFQVTILDIYHVF